MSVSIAAETPLQDDVRTLVAALNDTLLALTPREYCHHLTVEQMAGADTTLFVARDGDLIVGMGALKRHGDVGEVKRMYTVPARQGQGIGGRVLAAIEAQARADGLRRLVLETGNNFDAATHMYRRDGFAACGPVLDYPPTPFTAFFEKKLGAA